LNVKLNMIDKSYNFNGKDSPFVAAGLQEKPVGKILSRILTSEIALAIAPRYQAEGEMQFGDTMKLF